jgi:tRNA threonylcarbamoyl adenosine modification protein YjeE
MTDSGQKTIKQLTVGLDNLNDVADSVATSLMNSKKKPFVLWLVGDLGAGKTTFAGALFHALGVPQGVPVLSPTYTYLTEYKTDLGLCAHMDLYRLVEGDLDSLESLLSGRDFKGLVVEWPHRASGSPLLEKTHEIKFEFASSEGLRILTIESNF